MIIAVIKRIRKYRFTLIAAVLLFFSFGLCLYYYTMSTKRLSVDPASYTALLTVIAKAESNNNYEAHFGNPTNKKIKFTEMTIAEVLDWQKKFISKGSPSSAVGRYQIINTTLSGLVTALSIDLSQRFDEKMQDKLAIALLERRGGEQYINNELSDKDFAANLAKEWAGLPKVIGTHPERSYYAGDGLNASRVKIDTVLSAIKPISAK